MYFVRYCSEVPILLHIFDTGLFVITKLQIRPLNVFFRDVLSRYRSFRFVWNVRKVHSCAANSVNFISRAKKTILRCLPFWIVAPACSSCAGRFFIILFGLFLSLSLSRTIRCCSEKFLLRSLFAKIVTPSRAQRTFGKRKSGRTERKWNCLESRS